MSQDGTLGSCWLRSVENIFPEYDCLCRSLWLPVTISKSTFKLRGPIKLSLVRFVFCLFSIFFYLFHAESFQAQIFGIFIYFRLDGNSFKTEIKFQQQFQPLSVSAYGKDNYLVDHDNDNRYDRLKRKPFRSNKISVFPGRYERARDLLVVDFKRLKSKFENLGIVWRCLYNWWL